MNNSSASSISDHAGQIEKGSTAYRILFWGNAYAFMVTGIIVLMMGAIMPFLLRDFNMSYEQGGLILSLQAVGNLIANLMSGVLAMYIGRKLTMMLSAVCFVIGFGGILVSPSIGWLTVVIFISGLGWGAANNLVNTVMTEVTRRDGKAMNLLHMFYAIGAFGTPFIVSFSTQMKISWRYDVLLAAILSAVLIVVFAVMPLKNNGKKAATSPVKTAPDIVSGTVQGDSAGKGTVKAGFSFWKNVRFYIFTCIIFFYVGTENSINGWITTYFVRSDIMDAATAQNVLALLWLSVIFGRLGCAVLSSIFRPQTILVACAVGSTLFFALLLTLHQPVWIMICIFCMGLSIAGTYPTTVSNAGDIINQPGIAGGLMLASGGLGASVIPYVVGAVAEGRGIGSAMFVIICSFILFISAAVANLFLNPGKGSIKTAHK